MSEENPSIPNSVLTFLGSLGGMLIFALIIYIAYLPNQADEPDAEANEARQMKADEARAAGLSKITGYEVINKETETVRIPIELAMEQTLQAYSAGADTAK